MIWFFIFILFINPFSLIGQPVFEDYFSDATLRFDYYHAGSSDTSYIFLDEIKKEPSWAGSRTQLIDPFRYGEMLVEVHDASTNELIYSRGYSTLFIEWQTTSEAEHTPKSFPESVLIPFPKDSVILTLLKRDRTLEFHPLLEYTINPNSYFIERNTTTLYDTVSLINNGNPATKVDVVIIPDGYTTGEMEKFITDAQRYTELFFSWDPFSRNKKNFNFTAIIAPSRESGPDIPGQNTWKNTVLNSSFYTFNSERYLTTKDYHKVRDIASAVPNDQIIILVNSDKYGGGGIYNFYSTCTSDHPLSEIVFMHEFGHGFASLADEYYSSDVSYNDFFDLSVEPYQPNITTLKNFDVKWKDLIEPGTPVPTPPTEEYIDKVGVFEGGGYVAKGIYRPTFDGTMRSEVINGFGPVNERAIQQIIDLYTK